MLWSYPSLSLTGLPSLLQLLPVLAPLSSPFFFPSIWIPLLSVFFFPSPDPGEVLTGLPHSSKQDVQSPNPGSPLRLGSLMVILALLKIEIENELPSLNVFKKMPPLPTSVRS